MDGPIPQGLWDYDLTAVCQPGPNWLWDGFLAGGNVTLLTGLWKAAKTTLLSVLLSRLSDPDA